MKRSWWLVCFIWSVLLSQPCLSTRQLSVSATAAATEGPHLSSAASKPALSTSKSTSKSSFNKAAGQTARFASRRADAAATAKAGKYFGEYYTVAAPQRVTSDPMTDATVLLAQCGQLGAAVRYLAKTNDMMINAASVMPGGDGNEFKAGAPSGKMNSVGSNNMRCLLQDIVNTMDRLSYELQSADNARYPSLRVALERAQQLINKRGRCQSMPAPPNFRQAVDLWSQQLSSAESWISTSFTGYSASELLQVESILNASNVMTKTWFVHITGILNSLILADRDIAELHARQVRDTGQIAVTQGFWENLRPVFNQLQRNWKMRINALKGMTTQILDPGMSTNMYNILEPAVLRANACSDGGGCNMDGCAVTARTSEFDF